MISSAPFTENGSSILRDLVALRQVGIEVVLAREDRTLMNLESERQSGARAQLNHPPIQNRKRTRQTETHRTRVRVRLIAKARRASTEDFRFGAELGVDLQPDDCFPNLLALWINLAINDCGESIITPRNSRLAVGRTSGEGDPVVWGVCA